MPIVGGRAGTASPAGVSTVSFLRLGSPVAIGPSSSNVPRSFFAIGGVWAASIKHVAPKYELDSRRCPTSRGHCGGDVRCMTDPRNVAHDKKVQQEKKHRGEEIAPGAEHAPQPGKKPHLKEVDPSNDERSDPKENAPG